MFLHKNKKDFLDIINLVEEKTGQTGVIIEKDYYVTLILRLLSERLENVVFKGGTSLSKGFHIIDRFSEDIDITFNEHIGENRRKKLKNVIIKEISEILELPIINWNQTQSDRDYNAYLFSYESLFAPDEEIPSYVKMEIALGSYAFPIKKVQIENYIGNYLIGIGREDLALKYELNYFNMQLQTIERTFIDKIFALCDYYIQKRYRRCSRHMYDIYKLSGKVLLNDSLIDLFREVRLHRSKMSICPSAQENINIATLINEFCNNDFYKDDYLEITNYFINDYVSYETCINKLKEISNWIINNKL